MVACITQAAFKRVARFNVNCDVSFLNDVASAFRPSEGTRANVRSTTVATSKLSDGILADKKQLRSLRRFFTRFPCFRMLPQQFWAELMRKCEYRVFKNDEMLCRASGASPKMFMVLSGKVCVHYVGSLESNQLRSYDQTNYAFDPPMTKRKECLHQPSACLAECEVPNEIALLSRASTHICTLTGGDAFGEIGLRQRALLQGAALFNPITSEGPCAVVSLSYDDYHATWTRYLEATEFTADVVCNVLDNVLPPDRTCEQLGYLSAYLTRKSQARVFFSQLPMHILSKICLHACLEKHTVGDGVVDFIQREDEDVSAMRVVLNGYVCAFKNSSCHPVHLESDATATNGASSVVRQSQSRLRCGNTKLLDDMHAETTCRRSKESASGANDIQTVDPVSILPHGAAFGHHQIFTHSKSPYSYAAYSTGSPATTTLSHQDTIGRAAGTLAANSSGTVHVLSIPARFVRLCFTSIDEYLIYNPVRMFKRIAKAKEASAKSAVPISELLYGLHVDRFLSLSPCFSGIPRTRLDAAVAASLDVVPVPARRVLYEVGESTNGAIHFVLSGSVRTFTEYGSTKRRHQQKSARKEDKKAPELLRMGLQGLQATHAAMETKLPASATHPFDRYAGDHIFLKDYDRTSELTLGDCFGRQVGGGGGHEQGSRPFRGHLMDRGSILHQSVSSASGETAVTMSDCLIGSVSLKKPSDGWMLDAKEKRELVGLIHAREEMEISSDSTSSTPTDTNALATSFKVIERMRLATHLTTTQRACVASLLRYCRIKPGEIGTVLKSPSLIRPTLRAS